MGVALACCSSIESYSEFGCCTRRSQVGLTGNDFLPSFYLFCKSSISAWLITLVSCWNLIDWILRCRCPFLLMRSLSSCCCRFFVNLAQVAFDSDRSYLTSPLWKERILMFYTIESSLTLEILAWSVVWNRITIREQCHSLQSVRCLNI